MPVELVAAGKHADDVAADLRGGKMKALLVALLMLGALPAVASDREHFEGETGGRSTGSGRNWLNAPRRVKIVDERPIISDFRMTGYVGGVETASIALPPPPTGGTPAGAVEIATSSVESNSSNTSVASTSLVQPVAKHPVMKDASPPSSLMMMMNSRNPAQSYCAPGLVHWHRSIAHAAAKSAISRKPVFVVQVMGKLNEEFC